MENNMIKEISLVLFISTALMGCGENELCERYRNSTAQVAIEVSKMAKGVGDRNRTMAALGEAQSVAELISTRGIKCEIK